MEDYIAKALPFWKALTADQQKLIRGNTIVNRCKTYETLYDGLENKAGLMIVQHGQVGVFIQTAGGERMTLYRLGPQEICIASILCSMGKMDFFVQAIAEMPSTIYRIPMRIYMQICAENDAVKMFEWKQIVHLFEKMISLIGKIGFFDLSGRLACQLIEYSRIQSNPVITITHEALANDLGTSREVITRLLRQYESKGCLALCRKKIEILDLGALYRKKIDIM